MKTQKADHRDVPGHVGAVVPDGRARRVKQVEVVGARVGSVQAASGAAEDWSYIGRGWRHCRFHLQNSWCSEKSGSMKTAGQVDLVT